MNQSYQKTLLFFAFVFIPMMGWCEEVATSIYLKDGRTIPSTVVQPEGSNLMAAVVINGAAGKIGYPVANVARIDPPGHPLCERPATCSLAEKRPKLW